MKIPFDNLKFPNSQNERNYEEIDWKFGLYYMNRFAFS